MTTLNYHQRYQSLEDMKQLCVDRSHLLHQGRPPNPQN